MSISPGGLVVSASLTDVRILLLVVFSVVLPASSAWGQVETDSYFTSRNEQVLGLDSFDFDSDWQPSGSPIQVRLTAHADNSVYVGMDGDGFYDWGAQTIAFEGLTEGGEFDVDFGIDIQSQVRIDLLGVQWQGDLMDPVLYGIFETIFFDPYLLPGAPGRPGVLEASIPAETVLDVPLGIDLIVASGNFQLDVGAEVYAELEGNSITVESESEAAIVDAWDLAVSLGADPTSPLDVWATLEAYLYFEITLTLYPSVVLTVLGTDFTLAQIDIPIDVPPLDDTWTFEQEALSFAAPPPPEDPSGQPPGSESDPGANSTTFTDCGCSSSPTREAGSALLWLMLSTWAGFRLRRRPAASGEA